MSSNRILATIKTPCDYSAALRKLSQPCGEGLGCVCGSICCVCGNTERQRELAQPATNRTVVERDVIMSESCIKDLSDCGFWLGKKAIAGIFGAAGCFLGTVCCPVEAFRAYFCGHDPEINTPLLVCYDRQTLNAEPSYFGLSSCLTDATPTTKAPSVDARGLGNAAPEVETKEVPVSPGHAPQSLFGQSDKITPEISAQRNQALLTN